MSMIRLLMSDGNIIDFRYINLIDELYDVIINNYLKLNECVCVYF